MNGNPRFAAFEVLLGAAHDRGACNCDRDSRLVSDDGICVQCRLPVLMTLPNWLTGAGAVREIEQQQ